MIDFDFEFLDLGNGEACTRGACPVGLPRSYDSAVEAGDRERIDRVRAMIKNCVSPREIFRRQPEAVAERRPSSVIGTGLVVEDINIAGRKVRLAHNIEHRLVPIDGIHITMDDLSSDIAREFTHTVAAHSAAAGSADAHLVAAARQRIEDAVAWIVLSRPYRDATIRGMTRRETRVTV